MNLTDFAIPFIIGVGAGALALIFFHIVRAKDWSAREEIATTRLTDAEGQLTRQREDFDKAISNMEVTFKGLSTEVMRESREEFLKQAEPKLGEHIRPLKDALTRYEQAIRDIENKREKAYGGIQNMMSVIRTGQETLSRETVALTSALKSPTARGRWGEVTLERVVEVAGMSQYCDFDKQVSVETTEGKLRPDLVVRLPRGRSVVVDAKAPLDEYMKAMEAPDEERRKVHLIAHAKAVREHMRTLGQKNYWAQFDPTPDFVILFLPGESFFSAALEQDRGMIEDGMGSRVVLATPTTLIVMLRSVAMSWQQEQLAENSQRISEAGKDLFERCTTFAKHLGSVGKGLESALANYNKAVGSWETRVIPGTRTLKELGATRSPDADVPSIDTVQTTPRALTPSSGSENT